MAQVSVIIPVYNIERHLRQCLDSVTGQTLTELEIICVDDGSTDASPEILVDYAQRDGRFQIITQPNTGPGVARNTGMDRATGEYLIFLDSDDWFEPDFLERMVAKAKETGADVTICRTVEFDTQTGRELPSEWMLKTEGLPKTPWFSPKEAAEDLMKLHDYVKENFGYEMKYFRFPSGNFNEQTLAVVQSMGYKSVFWSFAYKDWLTDDQPDPKESEERIVKAACPGNIYLLHAVSSTNAQVMGSVIDRVRDAGYSWGDPGTL